MSNDKKMFVPVLYSFRRCPYAMRARMAIAYANDTDTVAQSVELREVWLKHKPQELLDVSPKGTVPVLLLPNGELLEESIDIMDWALGQSDPQGIGRIRAHAVGQDLVDENDSDFKLWLDRYKYADRHPEFDANYSRGQAERFIKKLEGLLGQHAYLLGDKLSVFDLAIFPFIRQFAMVDMAWFEKSEYAAVRGWLFSLMNSKKFISIMKKYPVWQANAMPTIFPTKDAS